MLRAAQALPAAEAGVIVRDNRTVSDAPGRQLLGDVRDELRYTAHAVQAGGTGTYLRESDGQLVTAPLDAIRIVDGKLYVDLDGTGHWQARSGAPTTGADGPETLAANARRGADRDAATALVQALTGVHQTGGDDGTTTYAGAITPAERTPWTHPTLASATDTLTIDYRGLGMPQEITAP